MYNREERIFIHGEKEAEARGEIIETKKSKLFKKKTKSEVTEPESEEKQDV